MPDGSRRAVRGAEAISADGRVVVTTPADESRLTFVTGAARRVVGAGDITVVPALAPDGGLAALQHLDRNWELLDTGSGRRVRALAGSAAVGEMAFSPDGRRLLGTISVRGQVGVWDVATGRQRFTVGGLASSVDAGFSPDGRYIVTADGGQAAVWDAQTGRRLVDLPAALRATMLPGDRAIVSTGLVGTPIIRRCDACGTWPQLVQRIEARHLRALTPAEQARYLR
jgi:WD40 repeat protein